MAKPTIVPIAPTRISSSEKGHGCHGASGRSPTPPGSRLARSGVARSPSRAPRARLAAEAAPAGRSAAAVAAGSRASLVPAPPERRLRGRPFLPAFRFDTDQPGGNSQRGMAVDRSAYAQRQMSLHTGSGEARPAGIPESSLPGPYPVGSYAAMLRRQLRKFARVQLLGELVNLRRRAHARLLRAARRRPARSPARRG